MLENEQTGFDYPVRTVLELDLVAYSDSADTLDEWLDVRAVKLLQDQVQAFVDIGLAAVGLSREDAVFGTAGDNALLLFPDAATAHRFAAAFHSATAAHNAGKRTGPARRWFRMGAATGRVLVLPLERRIVSTIIRDAVRLEASARRGELVVDQQTYNALPDTMKTEYGPEELVAGKRTETFLARRCQFVSDLAEPPPTIPPPTRDPFEDLYERLEDRFHSDYVPVAQIPALRNFAVKHMGPDIAPVETLLGWMSVNPRVFQSLSETITNDEQTITSIVGYFSLRPITREAVELLNSGKIDGACLRPEHILPHAVLPEAVYIGGVAAKDLPARAALILSIKGEVRHLRDRGVKTFFTKPLTTDGLRLAQKNGFLPVTPGQPDDKGVYKLTFAN